LHHERSVANDAERRERFVTRRCDVTMDVDSVRHDNDAICRNATRRQYTRDRPRDRDDDRRAPIFPTRSRVVPQSEIHPTGNNEWNVRPKRRKSGDSDRVRRVCVHDVDAMGSNRATELPRSSRIDLAERIARDDGQSGFDRTRRERFVRTCRDNGPMSATRQLTGEPERLTLSASPATLGIDMQHAQSHGAQLPLFEKHTQARC
jgi:hypothetical protein